MVTDEQLFSGQDSLTGEIKVEHSLSATSKVMPLHAGNSRLRLHHSPKRVTGQMPLIDKKVTDK